MTAAAAPRPPLRTCRHCGRWSRGLAPTGLCRDCRLGWAHCPEHGRLEHARSDHQRVSVADVLLAVPEEGGQPRG